MFLEILIGNIQNFKQLQHFFNFCRLTKHLNQGSYIIFCYNLKITFELKQILRTNPNIHIQRIKKYQTNDYLTFFFPYLHNSISLISCSEISELLKIVEFVAKTSLFIKINNNIYLFHSIDLNSYNLANLMLIFSSVTYQYITIFNQLSLK